MESKYTPLRTNGKSLELFLNTVDQATSTRVVYHTLNSFAKVYKFSNLRPSIDEIIDLTFEAIESSELFPCKLSLSLGYLLEEFETKTPVYRFYFASSNTNLIRNFLVAEDLVKVRQKLESQLNNANLYENLENYSSENNSKYRFVGLMTLLVRMNSIFRR